MRFIRAGFGGPGLFVGEDRLPYMYLTDEWKSRTLSRIQELVADAQVRAMRSSPSRKPRSSSWRPRSTNSVAWPTIG